MSDEHFSVDGSLIEAWASHKSFVKKDGSGPDNRMVKNHMLDTNFTEKMTVFGAKDFFRDTKYELNWL
ncbi:hypothetical protein A1356_10235 [Methylomonas koyamae]|uniref:Transposase n=1 Tax=Methylomonas koyamae TaxID=702114 RepID=A0AA91I6Q2_9GAMM|nr:hypothetical protein A1356_10235 [Methylomonas koyamae]